MPITGLPRSSTQCRKDAGTFHVPTFSVSDSGGPGRKGTAAPLRLVWGAHLIWADHQAPPYGTMQPEYVDEVEETGCGDIGKVLWGDLQYNGKGRSRVFLGGAFFQLFGVGLTLVGQGLDSGSSEHLEVDTTSGTVREFSEEGGSGPDRLRTVLPSGGPGGATLYVRNLGVDGSDAAKLKVVHVSFMRQVTGMKT